MNASTILTIPKAITGDEELIVMPKREFKEIWEQAAKSMREDEILKWSREAKSMKRFGKLPVLRSLKFLR